MVVGIMDFFVDFHQRAMVLPENKAPMIKLPEEWGNVYVLSPNAKHKAKVKRMCPKCHKPMTLALYIDHVCYDVVVVV